MAQNAQVKHATLRTEACVDVGVIRENVTALRGLAKAEVMAVVKANAYGHGLVPVARAALMGGATWLGVAFVEEALAIRAAGIDVPILCFLTTPGDDIVQAVRQNVDLSVSASWAVEAIAAAAEQAGRVARVHLKVDTGLSRGGAVAADWPDLVRTARKAEELTIVGIWSHLARADEPTHPMNMAQCAAFSDALTTAQSLDVTPSVRHLANSAALLSLPETHFDLVRAGIALYGLSPSPHIDLRSLRAAMTLRTRVALVKRVSSGSGVSYGHDYVTSSPTGLALIPLGYGDGVPRAASNTAEVWIGGKRRRIAGRVCMDQFVVDIGEDVVKPGDEVVLFGPGLYGEPTADDWAVALNTIGYEIVTRVGTRVPRTYVGNGGESVSEFNG